MGSRRLSGLVSESRRPLAFAVFALALVLVLGCIFNANGAFFTPFTHTETLWALACYGILACGMTVVIITGGIDLAVGSVVALVGVVFAHLTIMREQPAVVALPVAILVGTAAG